MKITVCRDLSDRALSYDVEPKLGQLILELLGAAYPIVEPELLSRRRLFSMQVPKGIVVGPIAAGVLFPAPHRV